MKNWELRSKKLYIHNKYRSLEDRVYLQPNNEESLFSIVCDPKIAVVFSLTKNNEVILARQFRPGPSKVLDEIPAGAIEDNEDPLMAAKRELLEETGFESNDWSYLGKAYNGAYSTMVKHWFLAKNCEKVSEQNLDDTEFIDVIIKSKEEFLKQLKNGDLTDSCLSWRVLAENLW